MGKEGSTRNKCLIKCAERSKLNMGPEIKVRSRPPWPPPPLIRPIHMTRPIRDSLVELRICLSESRFQGALVSLSSFVDVRSSVCVISYLSCLPRCTYATYYVARVLGLPVRRCIIRVYIILYLQASVQTSGVSLSLSLSLLIFFIKTGNRNKQRERKYGGQNWTSKQEKKKT